MKTELPAIPEVRPSPSSSYKWAVVGMLWLICFFNYADRQAVFSIFPLLQKQFGFNKEELGRIGAAFMMVYALSAPFAGQVGDRLPRKAVILGGLYIWSLVTGFTALCSRVWQFVIVRGAEGLGETFYFPASMSLVSDYHGKSTRSRAMSLHQSSVYVGTIGGGALAGWMAQSFGWQSPFLFLAAGGILLGIVLHRFIREPSRNEAEIAEADESQPVVAQIPMSRFIWECFQRPTVLRLILAFLGANFVAMQFLAWAPTFLTDKYKLSLAKAGLGGTFFIQVGSLLGVAVGGWMADRWRARLPGGRILTQAIGAALGAPFIYLFGRTNELGVILAAMALFGFFKGIYDANIWASLYDVIPVSRRGAGVGLMNMVGWLGGTLGVYLMGLLTERGMSMSEGFSYTFVIYVAAALLLTDAALRFAPQDVPTV